jgi:type II protein arginine methyltransferase
MQDEQPVARVSTLERPAVQTVQMSPPPAPAATVGAWPREGTTDAQLVPALAAAHQVRADFCALALSPQPRAERLAALGFAAAVEFGSASASKSETEPKSEPSSESRSGETKEESKSSSKGRDSGDAAAAPPTFVGLGAEPWTRSEDLLPSQNWSQQVCALLSPWIARDLSAPLRGGSEANSPSAAATPSQALAGSSTSATLAYNATVAGASAAFREELAWAIHLSLPGVILPLPQRSQMLYSREICRVAQSQLAFLQLWVHVPLIEPEEQEQQQSEAEATSDLGLGAWQRWNELRLVCDQHPNIFAALELTSDLPETRLLAQWMGEPVKCVIVPTSVFTTSTRGNPVLGPSHQQFLSVMILRGVQLIVRAPRDDNEAPIGDLSPYISYIRFLHQKCWESLTDQHAYESPYWDYLQAPLQPLMDNLESQTYETFERDSPKYIAYQEAIRQFLLDRPKDGETLVMVVGAGRGPLVKASLAAAAAAERDIKVVAVEKNPNAVVTLRHMHRDLGWGDRVTIVASDMRKWKTDRKADVLVSELLGSFGDNELSPECLDGAQTFLKRDGTSIPCAYTSYVAPMSSEKLWNDVRGQGAISSGQGGAHNGKKSFETGYVVKFHNATLLAEPQACFQFRHPNFDAPEGVEHNQRYASFVFTATESSVLHGFAGFFDTDLYKEVNLSIHPRTHTPDMSSWFPMFWPLEHPISVKAGDRIECHWWRCTDGRKVWYEWGVTQPSTGGIQNVGGRSSWIGL